MGQEPRPPTRGNDALDVWVLPRSEGAEPYPYAATDFDEHSAVLSPDGRWIAYVTLESGTCEVVVQSFADPAAGKRDPELDSARRKLSSE